MALVLLLGACTAVNPSATPTPTPTRDPNALNVTALLDLSGSRAPNGGPQRDALQLWADQHSSGTPRVKLKITDVASSPSKTALELRREVVEARADAIIVGVSVDYDDAFANVVQLAQVPVLFTLPIPEPATRGGGWAFALGPTPAQLARVVLNGAAQRSLLASGLLVSDESTTAISERIAFASELARRNVTPNVVTVTPTDATGKLRTLLATTTIVFFAGTPRSYLEAARSATVGTTLYLSYLCDFSDIGELRDAAPLAVWPGSRWVASSAAGTSTAARTSFVQVYTDRSGPPTSVAASAYDALALLSSAAEKSIDPVSVRNQLQSGTFAGVATTYTFSQSQHAGFNTGDLALLRYVAPRVPPAVR
ncbi:MAG: ABC transporter substrate-binding protein [Chloroflexota bacterium]|nr:ABC transporter substrate-binding protein [Chloroflexota bacterium]